MKENRKHKYHGTIFYILAFAGLSWFLYGTIVNVSPFARAGVMLVVCVFIYLGTRLRVKGADKEKAQGQMKLAFLIMFALYGVLLVGLLFFDGYFGRDTVHFEGDFNKENLRLYLQSSLNLVPFRMIGSLTYSCVRGWIPVSTPLINIGGNLVAFMPFAIFLPVFFNNPRKAFPFTLWVAGTVVVVELLQLLFQRGVCDIDDLILNAGGAGLLFIILHTKPVKKGMDKLTFGLYK